MKETKVLIVEDMPLVNEGISLLLNKEPNLKVVGSAKTGPECLQFLKKHLVDLVVLDHQLPGQTGLEILCQIQAVSRKIKVVLLTFLFEEKLIRKYLDSGVAGCLLKHDSPQEFTYGIQQVAKGESYISSTVSQVLNGQLGRTPNAPKAHRDNLESLTKAEFQVLTLIGKGLSVEEIGKTRHTSVNTVGRQKQNIMDKLDIHKETKLMRFAIELGLG